MAGKKTMAGKVIDKITGTKTDEKPVIHKADVPLMLTEAEEIAGYLNLGGLQASAQIVVIIHNTMKMYRERGTSISMADMKNMIKEVQTNPAYNPPQQKH